MDERAAKLALARKKLKDHQEKKLVSNQKEEYLDGFSQQNIPKSNQLMINRDPSEIEETKDRAQHHTLQHEIIHEKNYKDMQAVESDLNVTEILISSKRSLELQVKELQSKRSQLECNYTLEINNHNVTKQKIFNLETEIKNIHDKYLNAKDEILIKEKTIEELNSIKSSLHDKNNNLVEQLEFMKTVLTAKETENTSLHSQLYNLQNQLEAVQLNVQQLSNGSMNYSSHNINNVDVCQNEAMLQKISNLEQQLKTLHKERDQSHQHYEHYVGELNEQLRLISLKNEDLSKVIHDLSNRENSLIDQISELEIRLQNYQTKTVCEDQTSNIEMNELQQNFIKVHDELQELRTKYNELQKQYLESEAKVKELSEIKDSSCKHDDISISKLNADITSDKIAAQRATEQNKKLKTDIHELEEAFIKMSSDKLDLTEKLVAEKFLNRELTIKLAEIEERARDMHTKLMAKDEEMIRLQTSYRTLEKQFEQLCYNVKQTKENAVSVTDQESQKAVITESSQENENTHCNFVEDENMYLIKTETEKNLLNMAKEDAMLKLQDRFLKIMEEVADLSDEKHRLEHIILQLQNETDTICEYVALYQQQRSLLKKRDEERSAQIKVFQLECDRLKSHLEDLNKLLIKFAEDKELSSYFQVEWRRNDIESIMKLLAELKNNTLIDPKKKHLELKDFYPCNCCSGKLIDV